MDFCAQGVWRTGFEKKRTVFLQVRARFRETVFIAGDVEDLNLWAENSHMGSKVLAVHIRQVAVREEKMDGIGALLAKA